MKYTEYEQREEWLTMPEIPRDHVFKKIPLEVLDGLGWRWLPDMNSYYIPYFDKSKHYVPFSQMRHLTGERRFTFLKEAKPMIYGLWNLDNPKLFLVEGTSDAAVLDYAAVPWIAAPSASSGALVGLLAGFCADNGIELVFAGDNDSAGFKLREALDEAGHGYRVKQAPKIYKDWGDFFEAQGLGAVQEYCFAELIINIEPQSDIDKILEKFPGAKVQKVVGSEENVVRSNQSVEPTSLF